MIRLSTLHSLEEAICRVQVVCCRFVARFLLATHQSRRQWRMPNAAISGCFLIRSFSVFLGVSHMPITVRKLLVRYVPVKSRTFRRNVFVLPNFIKPREMAVSSKKIAALIRESVAVPLGRCVSVLDAAFDIDACRRP